jgi:hypothetical protein
VRHSVLRLWFMVPEFGVVEGGLREGSTRSVLWIGSGTSQLVEVWS